MNVTLRFVGMLTILLVGVVLGLQTAEKGIYKVDGLPEQKPQTFYIKKIDKGQVEIAVMGKEVKAKPQQVVNYVSETGTSIGGWIKNSVKSTVDWFSQFFQP
ncbi:DUF3679 domain-containing protein [Brevibacillus dissolubilis]|uniref:DUF3679 domain-containing protein n=1 Tax=Brevibacillus dissolubilis TaxID=1844116 RepID=UPI0011171825|nr:DUF3679 domain-containing protein [Brevibacillus dissolubilis]